MTKTFKAVGLAIATALVLAAGSATMFAVRQLPAARALIGAARDVAGAVVYAAQDPTGGPGPFRGRGGPGGPGRFGGPGGPPPFGGPGGPGGPAGVALERLGLSEVQKDQVKAVMQSHQDEGKGLADRMAAARQALDDAVTADVPDEGAIRGRSADLASIEADEAVLRARVRSEVLQLLTPEQQSQAKQMQAKMKERQAQLQQRLRRPPQPPQ